MNNSAKLWLNSIIGKKYWYNRELYHILEVFLSIDDICPIYKKVEPRLIVEFSFMVVPCTGCKDIQVYIVLCIIDHITRYSFATKIPKLFHY